MKKILLILTTIFTLSKGLACFIDDPCHYLKIISQTYTYENIGCVTTIYSKTFKAVPTDWKWNGTTYNVNTQSAFPLTITAQFSTENNFKPTKAYLLYLNKKGKLQFLQKIENVNWSIESNEGYGRALWGQMSIPNSCGYKPGEILYILLYFEDANGNATHNLNNLLLTTFNNTDNKPENTNGMFAIGVGTNIRPF